MTPPVTKPSSSDAFSLIEVVLAIGIVAFAFVAILGLLPVGMTTFRQAMDTSTSSQIIQRVINEAQQTKYATLVESGSTTKHFDDQGNEVEPAFSIYTVEVLVTAPTILPESSAGPSANLASVRVRVAHNPGRDPNPFDPTRVFPRIEQSAFIAKGQ